MVIPSFNGLNLLSILSLFALPAGGSMIVGGLALVGHSIRMN